MSPDPAWGRWMDRAVELATDHRAPRGENPRVGCVIVDPAGNVIGEGFHRGAGTAHAEIVALAEAGTRSRGGTAIVTLEPCRHTGRTGPCTRALIDAGITRVVFAQEDPTSVAGGGAGELRDAGVDVVAGVHAGSAEAINREWTIAVRRGRPFVTAKIAVSLDGRVAGQGGRRVQLTGKPAQIFAHELRARVQAIITGTGTVLEDDPALTVREVPPSVSGQPLRVVMGARQVPATSRVLNDAAETLVLSSRDPLAVLATLFERGVRHVLVEAGPTLLGAFWDAGCVDELEWLLAGVWLGGGPRVLPARTPVIDRVTVATTQTLGQDVRIQVLPVPATTGKA